MLKRHTKKTKAEKKIAIEERIAAEPICNQICSSICYEPGDRGEDFYFAFLPISFVA
jgi:hypothetical protein